MTGRGKPPPPGPIRPYEFPPVADERLGNGMRVRVVQKQPLGLVTAMVVLRAGETAAPAGREGLAVLAGDALEGGTTRLSSVELACRLEDIGASFGAATGWDSTTVAVSCLADNLVDALPLLAEMVRSPAFDQAEFDRYKAQRLATAAHRRMDPASLAADCHARSIYGDGDTYARPLGGTEASLGALEADHARQYAAARYGPARAAVVVVGDVESEEVRQLADREFGDWGEQSANPPEAVVAGREPGRSIHVVHRPGSVQSEIRVGHVGVSRFIEDYLPLTVVNLVLGGSFSSRLNLNLREHHGFTYGVRSTFAARRNLGPFVVSTAVENSVTAAAVREIFREVEALSESGPTADEVQTATSYLAGVFPLRMESTGQVASRIAGLIVFGLPVDYYRDYRDRIREVTREQAMAAARRHIRPRELCTVVVGDADAVAPGLEDLKIGPVTIHDLQG
ncbi:MAG: insulinase family protein [Gemmatimonadetes bacterium]|nr:insulinase family protein [Gemmatimonadota bacterium]MYG35580.1 insulinase family protein [Gemmatimonadota bacterium]